MLLAQRTLVLTLFLSLACSGENHSSDRDDVDDNGNDNNTVAQADWEFWSSAEGEWTTKERAFSTDCDSSASGLVFIDVDEQECVSLRRNDYRGQLLLVGQDCENGLGRAATSFELDTDGRMVTPALEYFQPESVDYPCAWRRSQSEFVFDQGEPMMVFYAWSFDFEGVFTCPEELPQDAEPTCAKFVYRFQQ